MGGPGSTMEGSYRFPPGLDLGCSYGSYLISRKSNKRAEPQLKSLGSKPQTKLPPVPPSAAAAATTSTVPTAKDQSYNLHIIVHSLTQLLSVVNDLNAVASTSGSGTNSTLLSIMSVISQLTMCRDDTRTLQLIQQCIDLVTVTLHETIKHLHINQYDMGNEVKQDTVHSKKQVTDRRKIGKLERQISILNQRINELERKEHTLMKELNEEQMKVKLLRNKLRMNGKLKTFDLHSQRESYKDELYELAHFKDQKTASKTVNKLKEFGVIK